MKDHEDARKKAEDKAKAQDLEIKKLKEAAANPAPSLPDLINKEELKETKGKLVAVEKEKMDAEKRAKEKEDALKNLKTDVDFITQELNEKVKENQALNKEL